MTTAITKVARTGKKPAAGPLRLVTDNLSPQDKELLSYFHAMKHEIRPSVLILLRNAAAAQPLDDPDDEPWPGIRLVSRS